MNTAKKRDTFLLKAMAVGAVLGAIGGIKVALMVKMAPYCIHWGMTQVIRMFDDAGLEFPFLLLVRREIERTRAGRG